MSNVNRATVVIPFCFEIETHYLYGVYSSFFHLFIHLFVHSFNKTESLLCAGQSLCLPQQQQQPSLLIKDF